MVGGLRWRRHRPLLSQLGPPWVQSEPERLRSELEAFLSQQGIGFTYSQTSKFANFRNKTLL